MPSMKRFAAGAIQAPPKSAKKCASVVARAGLASARAEQLLLAGKEVAALRACRRASSLLAKAELQLARALDRSP